MSATDINTKRTEKKKKKKNNLQIGKRQGE